MADSSSPSPGWRSPGARPARPTVVRHGWQPKATASIHRPRPRWLRRLIATGSIGVTLALLLFFLPRGCAPAPRVIVSAMPQELVASPSGMSNVLALPPNPYALQTGQDLLQEAPSPHLFGGASDAVALSGPKDTDTASAWLKGLKLPTDNRPLVLYLSLQGGATREGKPFLWVVPAGAPFADPEKHALSMADLLKALPAKSPKLLLLDVSPSPVSWPLGQLRNDFVHALKEKLNDAIAAVPNLVVICSAGEWQRSWAWEGRGRTVFGEFVLEQMQARSQFSASVSAWELYESVSARVKEWALKNRDADQEPLLLPLGPDGEKRARDLRLKQFKTLAVSKPSAPPDLGPLWKDRDELAARAVPPEVMAPRQWRRYQELLLRAEQLARAGVADPALTAEIQGLAGRLKRESPSLRSLGYSLPLAIALGVAPSGLGLSQADLDEMWRNTAAPDKLGAAWAKLQKLANDRGLSHERLPLEIARLVLDRLERPGAETGDLDTAATVLTTVDKADAWPVEIHLLLELQKFYADPRHKDGRPDPSLLRLALQLRQQAEIDALAVVQEAPGPGKPPRIAPYAEQIARWTRQAVRSADALRRPAEDLLFATAKSQPEASADLTKAAAAYVDVERTARTVATALGLRDRAFARLPYLARWVANSPDFDPKSLAEVNALVGQAEQALQAAHDLSALLDDANLERWRPEEFRAKVEQLQALVGPLQQHLDALEGAYRATVERLKGERGNPNFRDLWYELDNALSVPFLLSSEDRAWMRRALTESPGAGQEGSVHLDAEAARRAARRHGQLALAVLGRRWVDETRPSDGRAFDKLRETFASGTDEDLIRAGAQLAGHWRELALRLPAEMNAADRVGPVEARVHLARAAQMDRLIDGATRVSDALDPVGELRRCDQHFLLLEQARRALNDGWAALGPGDDYCLVVARAFRDDAQDLVAASAPDGAAREQRLTEVRNLKLAIERVGIQAQKKSVDEVGTRTALPLLFTLTPPGQWPTDGGTVGYPIFEAALSNGPGLRLESPTERERIDFVTAKQATIGVNLSVNTSAGSKADFPEQLVTGRLFHRGRWINAQVSVKIGGRPTIEWTYEPPPRENAGFIVLGNQRLGDGAVCILFDITPSMSEPPEKGAKGSKIKLAREALQRVLQQLPEGTMFNFATFYGEHDAAQLRLKWLWDDGPRPWKKQWDEIAPMIDHLAPSDACTPLGRAIAEVLGRPKPADFQNRPVNLVVLTDGADNDLPENGPPGPPVRKALRNYPGHLDLHLILFGLGDEEETALKQFRMIEPQPDDPPDLGTRGRIWPASANASGRLEEFLKKALLPRIQVYKTRDLIRSLDVSPPAGEVFPKESLPPGEYDVDILGARGKLKLLPADRLLLELQSGPGGRLELGVPFTDVANEGRPRQPQVQRSEILNDLRLTVPAVRRETVEGQGGQAGSHGLRLRATLQKRILRSTPNHPLEQARPQFAWFYVNPSGPAPELTVHNLHGRFQPTWELALRNWPEQKELPLVEALWVDSWPQKSGDALRGLKLRDLARQSGPRPELKTVDGTDVTINDLRFEGGVLRLSVIHAKGQPVVAMLDGLFLSNEERLLELREDHSYYEPDGQRRLYTATFQGANGGIPERYWDQPFAICFYTLSSLHLSAERNPNGGMTLLRRRLEYTTATADQPPAIPLPAGR